MPQVASLHALQLPPSPSAFLEDKTRARDYSTYRTPDQVGIICARCGWTAAGPGLDMGGTGPDETHGEIN
jgi:hypothetical protein